MSVRKYNEWFKICKVRVVHKAIVFCIRQLFVRTYGFSDDHQGFNFENILFCETKFIP